jgi:hypothetical protein
MLALLLLLDAVELRPANVSVQAVERPGPSTDECALPQVDSFSSQHGVARSVHEVALLWATCRTPILLC